LGHLADRLPQAAFIPTSISWITDGNYHETLDLRPELGRIGRINCRTAPYGR
jgi:hypothetical protein